MKTVRLLSLVILFTAMLCLISCSGEDEPASTEILSVEIDKKGESIEIKATLDNEYTEGHKREKIYLIELETTSVASRLGGAVPLDYTTVKEKIEFEIPLYEGGRSRLCSSFVIAEYSEGDESTPAAYVPITAAAYIENPEVLAKNSASIKDPASIKGLSPDDTNMAAHLGVSHALYEVRIDEILLEDYAPGAITHNFGGETFFFDSVQTAKLDKSIKTATDNGMRVYLRFVLGMPESDEDGKLPGEPISSLYCPDAELGKEGYMINMTDKSAVRYVNAVFDFFAQRYATSDGRYGCAADFIIGKSVNDRTNYNNAGQWQTDLYESCYNSLVRTAHNVLRSYCSEGQVYVPVNELWRAEESSTLTGSKTFLNRFLINAKAGLDYGWGVAADLGCEENVWATASEAYNDISVKSLHELTSLFSTDDYLYGSTSRRIIVSDFSISAASPLEAEAYAYAYYTVADSSDVSAFIYSAHKSNGTSKGLVDETGSKTAMYDVFAVCGTSLADSSTLSAANMGETWNHISAAVASESLQTALLTQSSGTSTLDSSRLRSEKALYDFSTGNDFGFFADGGTEYCALVKKTTVDGEISALRIVPSASIENTTGHSDETAVIRKTDIRASELKSSGYIGIKCGSDMAGQKVIVTITDDDLRDSKTAVFKGEAVVSNDMQNIYFDISDFSRRISSSNDLTLSIYIENESDPAPITLYGIYLYGSSGSGAGSVVTTVIVTVIILAFIAILFFLVIRRKRNYSED